MSELKILFFCDQGGTQVALRYEEEKCTARKIRKPL